MFTLRRPGCAMKPRAREGEPVCLDPLPDVQFFNFLFPSTSFYSQNPPILAGEIGWKMGPWGCLFIT